MNISLLMLNRLLAFLIFLLLSPIFILVALAIFLEDGLPVFFKQKRVGVNYSFFNIYKFRSMKKNTPNVATHLLENPGQYLLKIGGLLILLREKWYLLARGQHYITKMI